MDRSHRAPLPESVEVTGVASSASAIWFLGNDWQTGAAKPVVYQWSAEGVRQFDLPEVASVQRLAATRSGSVLLLAAGRLYSARGHQFVPEREDPRTAEVIGGEGFWLLTDDNRLQYAGSGDFHPVEVSRLPVRPTAWTVTVGGDLVYALPGGRIFRLPIQAEAATEVENAECDVTALYASSAGEVRSSCDAAAFVSSRNGVLYAVAGASLLRGFTGAEPMQRVDVSAPVQALANDAWGGTWVSVGRLGAFRIEGLAEVGWPRGSAVTQQTSKAAAIPVAALREQFAESSTGIEALPGGRITNLNSSRGLPNDYISCVVSDGKDMYFGTGWANQGDDPPQAGNGFIRWDHRAFTQYLPNTTVHACAYDSTNGFVWFGTTTGLIRFTPSSGATATFLVGSAVQDVLPVSGEIWVATFNNGLYRLNSSGAQLAQVNVGNNKLTSLVLDAAGTLWIGTSGTGLYRYSGGTVAAESGAGGSDKIVQDLATDLSGNVWISVWNLGVYRRSSAGAFTRFNVGPAVAGYYRIWRILRNTNGDLWFTHGYIGALSYLPAAEVNSGTPQFRTYTTLNGLPANSAVAVGAEGTGAIWVGSPGGGAWRIGGPALKWSASLSGLPYHSSPLLVDLDNNNDLETVIGDQSGRIYAFRPNGTLLWSYDTVNAIVGRPAGDMAVQSSAAAADVDGDGELEIVVGLSGMLFSGETPGQGGVLILSRTGQFERMLYTFDITDSRRDGPEDGFTEGVFATPVLANVDADPEPEILVGAFDNQFYGWNADGTPIYTKDNDNDGRYDEDGLGDQTPRTPFNPTDDAPGVKGVDDDRDGQTDEGHPADDDEDGLIDEDYSEFPFNARDTTLTSAVVADINNDGRKEIIFGHDYAGGPNQEFGRGGVLRVLDEQGNEVAGFPKGNLEQVIWSSPVLVDLDGDGTYEIAHGSGMELGTVGDTTAEQLVGQLVYAWRANGTPFISGSNGRFATTEGRSWASFAVGDLDNDGQPELVITTSALTNKWGQPINASGAVVPEAQAIGQKLYAFRANGQLMPGFPVRPDVLFPTANLVGSPVLADVNGDGYLDIVVPVGQGLMVFDRVGDVLPGLGRFENLQDETLRDVITTTPAVADIDGDGSIEVVWAMGTGTGTGVVRVVSLGTINNTLYQRSWPQWRRAVNRNAIFGPLVSTVQGSLSGSTLSIGAQAFSGRSAISTVVANLQSIGGGTLSLASTTNAYFRGTTSVAGVAPGRYAIPITVTDTAGKSDVQTLIFVQHSTTRQLALSTTTLAFGSVAQGQSSSLQLNLVNIGNAPVNISKVASSSGEFVVAVPTSFPQTLAAGATLQVTVRFRPSGSSGARTASLTISSDDATAATRTVALTGTAGAGTGGGGGGTACTITLNGAPTTPFTPARRTGSFTLTTSPAGCAWTASSNVSWVQVFPISGTGQGTISYTIFPNFSTRTRSGAVNFNGALWQVTQNPRVGTADERFVAAMYFAFFGREAGTSEVAFHVGTLPTIGRAGLVWNFLNSAEFNVGGRFVAGLYVGLLNRDAEYGGWLFQRDALASGNVTPNTLVQNFLTTPEYVQKFGNPSNEEFVRLLYRYVLLREAAASEVSFHSGYLASGSLTRVQLATSFLNSAEFRNGTGPRLTAFLLYALLLQRDPSPSEFSARVAQISGEASIRALISEFLGSAEFGALLL